MTEMLWPLAAGHVVKLGQDALDGIPATASIKKQHDSVITISRARIISRSPAGSAKFKKRSIGRGCKVAGLMCRLKTELTVPKLTPTMHSQAMPEEK